MDMNVIELFCSRLCHDLVNPVGAIRNGLELLEETGDAGGFAGEAVRLIAHSADQADHRLRLFRLAYGRAGREARDFGDVRAAAADWLAGGRTRLVWEAGAIPEIAATRPGVAKLALCLVVSADEALPAGGTITVAGTGDKSSGRIEVTATGRDARLSAETENELMGRVGGELTPRVIHAHIVSAEAAFYGARPGVSLKPGEAILSVAW